MTWQQTGKQADRLKHWDRQTEKHTYWQRQTQERERQDRQRDRLRDWQSDRQTGWQTNTQTVHKSKAQIWQTALWRSGSFMFSSLQIFKLKKYMKFVLWKLDVLMDSSTDSCMFERVLSRGGPKSQFSGRSQFLLLWEPDLLWQIRITSVYLIRGRFDTMTDSSDETFS